MAADGAGSITQEEMTNFAQGVQRVLEEDLAGANAKIIAKSIDIYEGSRALFTRQEGASKQQ